jgi:hypothetical protein
MSRWPPRAVFRGARSWGAGSSRSVSATFPRGRVNTPILDGGRNASSASFIWIFVEYGIGLRALSVKNPASKWPVILSKRFNFKFSYAQVSQNTFQESVCSRHLRLVVTIFFASGSVGFTGRGPTADGSDPSAHFPDGCGGEDWFRTDRKGRHRREVGSCRREGPIGARAFQGPIAPGKLPGDNVTHCASIPESPVVSMTHQ